MTINGGKPHAVGYSGQSFKITVFDQELGERVTLGWSDAPLADPQLRAIETRPSWSHARSETVSDPQTGA
jgi:hypothetical protein